MQRTHIAFINTPKHTHTQAHSHMLIFTAINIQGVASAAAAVAATSAAVALATAVIPLLLLAARRRIDSIVDFRVPWCARFF